MNINNIKLKDGLSLIEASAGTGKSFTLSHIVIRSIFENNINPENILLLSFTNNTCKELSLKINERIDNFENYITNKTNNVDITLRNWCDNFIKNNPNKDKIIKNIKNVKDNINYLSITTFHGLCKKIIDDYSIELSTKLGSTLNNTIDELYISIVNELWIEEYSQLEREIIKSIENKKISTKYNKKEINAINKKLFINLLREIDQENICKYNTQYNDVLDTNKFLTEYIYSAWNQFCEEWSRTGEDLFKFLIKLGQLIEEKGFKSRIYSGKPRDKFKKISNWILEINKELNEKDIIKIISDISNDDLLSKYFYDKTIIREANKYNINVDLSDFKNLQHKIYELKDGFFNEFIRIILNKAYLKLLALKDKKNIHNYNDLIKTIENKYLNKNIQDERSIKYIKKKYKCILIDEFQDTDIIQWSIIKKLFNDNHHFLLCVGDPKQAIYKFRGGDIKTYLNAKNDSKNTYTLVDNYRTSKELIGVINYMYRNGLLNSKLNYPKLNAKNDTTMKCGDVFQIIEFSEKDICLEDYLINYLQYLLTNFKDIDINKVAILTLYNYQCIAIKDILFKNNLPCKIINKNNIFDTESSRLLELFINCLVNPFSINNIMLLVTSKFIQTEVDVFADFDNNKEIDKVSERLREWSNDLEELGFINLVNELINDYKSPFIIQNNDLMMNLFQLAEIVEHELIRNNYNLNNLLYWYQNELNKDTRKLIGEEYFIKNYYQNQGINISTIHSSKGLEYDIVICPYLWDIRKSSSYLKGPIWKDYKKREMYINIKDSHHKVKNLKSIEEKDLGNESERLIYVALTRAKFKLIIFNNIDNLDNTLNKNLLEVFPNKEKYLFKKQIDLKQTQIDQLKNRYTNNFTNKSPWSFYEKNKRIYKDNYVKEYLTRTSYSSWISLNNESNFNLKDYQDNSSIVKSKLIQNTNKSSDLLTEATPLSSFPKGTNAGACLHKVIERYNFHNEDLQNLRKIIGEELKNFDIDISFLKKVEDTILRVARCSLGEKLQYKRLIDIPNSQILKELKYDLALSKNGLAVKSEDIAKCFCIEKQYDFGVNYSKKIEDLKIHSAGFHSGFIDCVVPIGENLDNSKWWIIDWKSNYISSSNESECIPQNYNYENMKSEMIKHHYPLQSHLYLLALHRLLKWRLKNYDPIKNLGGYVYIFLRGLPKTSVENKFNSNEISPGLFIGNAPLKRINYLDNLFKIGSIL